MKSIFAMVGMVGLTLAVLFGISFGSYEMYKFFAPKYRAVDNQVYHESEQYNEGMIRDLEELQMQYVQANDTQKAALKSIILHRFEVYPTDKLPPNLFAFYNDLRSGRQ
jgi:hypothetical protein